MIRVGEAAGVSHATVSDVLNGRWKRKRISPDTRDRVLRAARELNYRPNRVVRSLFTGRTQTVAAVLHSVSGLYFPRIANGIEEEARRHGYHLMISRVRREEDETGEIEALLERRVDGLILSPRVDAEHQANYRHLISQGIPLVFVNSYMRNVPCPAVVGADEEGMRAVTGHLVALGHRRLAYVGATDTRIAHMRDRHRGFLRALAGHGLEVTDTPPCMDADSVAAAVVAALSRCPRPTALVAATDYLAVIAFETLESMGLRVPEDVALTGFSDCLENVSLYRVPLTSVRVDLEELGRTAMRRLLGEIENGVSRKLEVARMPATMVVRASSGCEIAKGMTA
ncbi:MAG: LacI family DNA-binding transcriptional regulator [Kiritimatiellae bacterium]|nr:LacI family DNA-binding transcriptional regulator [Kiritimatiellia bacterium]